MIVVGWIVLAPMLVCTAGTLLLVLFQRVGVESRFSNQTGLVAVGLALGATVRIWELARYQPLVVSIGDWSAPAVVDVSLRVDPVAATWMAICLVAALPIVAHVESASRGESIFCLASLGLAGALFATEDLSLLAIVWTVILILGAIRLIYLGRFAESITSLTFALFGAPILLACAAVLSSVSSPSQSSNALVSLAFAALIAVGAASVGLGPFRQIRAIASDRPNLDIVNDIVLPLIGFDLVLRAVTSAPNTMPIWVSSLLVLLGFTGILEATEAARKAGHLAELVRACNRANLALAFLVLALGHASAVSAALFLVAVSIIAQAIALAEHSDWLVRLGLGSLAGFPPLPGFLGRSALVVVALSAGSWPVALAISMGIAMTSFGFWRGLARLNLAGSAAEPNPARARAATFVPVAAIIGATLAPGTWLVTTLLPAAALSGQVAPLPSLTKALVALVLVVLPIMFAAALVRYPERIQRAKARTRLPRDATRWMLEPAEELAASVRQVEERYGLAIGILVAVGTILALVT